MTDDPQALALCYEHAFDIRINFDKRWMFGPVSGGSSWGYTSVGEGGNRLRAAAQRQIGRLQRRRLAGSARRRRRRSQRPLYAGGGRRQPASTSATWAMCMGRCAVRIRGRTKRHAFRAIFRCTPYFKAPVGPARLAQPDGDRRCGQAGAEGYGRRPSGSFAVPLLCGALRANSPSPLAGEGCADLATLPPSRSWVRGKRLPAIARSFAPLTLIQLRLIRCAHKATYPSPLKGEGWN